MIRQLHMPSSIFVRIYGGLLLAITIIALGAYFFVHWLNAERAENYRESMASGFFHLIALGVSRQADDNNRQLWIKKTSELIDSPIELTYAETENFSHIENYKLKNGRSIFRSNKTQNYADIYAQIPNQKNLFIKTRLSKVSEQQAKALAILYLAELSYYPKKEQQRIQELESFFPYEVNLTLLKEANLEKDQIMRIHRNEVVLVLKEGSDTRNSSLRIVTAVPKTDKVLVLGPLYIFDWRPMQLIISVATALLGLITFAAYFIILPLERKLKKVEVAVRDLRAGNLSARASIRGRDEVTQLATAFNSMAEHIQRLIDSQRELTRAVSHELRTPVARLRFGIDMLADTDSSEQRYEQLTLLDEDIEQLNQLIDEILTYATLEQGTPSLKFEAIVLEQLAQRIIQETKALNTPHQLSLSIDPDLVIEGEYRYIHRLLQNLVGNAIRYAHSHVRISAYQKNDQTFLSVEDDGLGIPEKDRARVFEPFARLDDSRTRSSGGYGLGLSIVSRIAFWHNGRMEVTQSGALGGACFTLTIPSQRKN